MQPNHRREAGRLNPSFAHLFYKLLPFICLLLLFSVGVWAQTTPADPLSPLPQDTGTNGLKLMLRRLNTTARLLQVTAHPDDEDGGMLTLESRGRGVTTTLLTLNRGEGGQNKVGSNLFDVLGVLRTLELTASDRYYGVEQRFTRVADFGFSKSPEETFQKWQGHDVALGDMVRVIRTFRPDVLIARFSGTSRDGHGHHEASGILTKEAFRAAADPNRFPEQIKEGLLPWQAKKLYVGNVCGFGASSCPDENYTVKLNTGQTDPLLGMSSIQFALEGLRHQLSQGAGGWSVEPGDRFTFYKLVDSVSATGSAAHEKDFFDGIETSLNGLAARLRDTEGDIPFLRQSLTDISALLQKAQENGDHPERTVAPLLNALDKLDRVVDALAHTDLGPAGQDVLDILREKQQQCETAANIGLNLSVEVTVTSSSNPGAKPPSEKDALTMLSPGQAATVIVKFHNGSNQTLEIQDAKLEAPEGFLAKSYKSNVTTLGAGEDFYANFYIRIPQTAKDTRPYWHRDNPEVDSIYTIDDAKFLTSPFAPPPMKVQVRYSVGATSSRLKQLRPKHQDATLAGRMSAPVSTKFTDDQGKVHERAVAVVPTYSVMLEPGGQVIAVGGSTRTTVKVAVSSNLANIPIGKLHLAVPDSWRVEPSETQVRLDQRGERQDFEFAVFPASLKEGRAQIRAVLNSGGKTYEEGYTIVSREDLDTAYYYQPATQRISIVDVKVPQNLKVGYIMGAGDDIPTVLKQIGMDVTNIASEKIATEDLSRYGTIVLGIRVYDTQKDVIANNKKLLDFVSNGGTLIVQYNASIGDFNAGHFTPYPAQLGRTRVSVEEAPIYILEPNDSIFHFPNEIGSGDYSGWVQERGLYFADTWDEHFKALLASHDPGEPLQKGGMLRAQYGKGTYIYTGYAFFRQLPAGVPGAVRLFVNLLSAGHEGSR